MDMTTNATPWTPIEQLDPTEEGFRITTEHGELIRLHPDFAKGKGSVFQLVIYGGLDAYGWRTVRDIKEQEVELDIPVLPLNALLAWAETVKAVFACGAHEVMMPREFLDCLRDVSLLKKARTQEDYMKSFKVKSRFGKWLPKMVMP